MYQSISISLPAKKRAVARGAISTLGAGLVRSLLSSDRRGRARVVWAGGTCEHQLTGRMCVFMIKIFAIPKNIWFTGVHASLHRVSLLLCCWPQPPMDPLTPLSHFTVVLQCGHLVTCNTRRGGVRKGTGGGVDGVNVE